MDSLIFIIKHQRLMYKVEKEMKKYFACLLCFITLFGIKESRASGCEQAYMDMEIIDIITPPQENKSNYPCKLKVKIKKIHKNESYQFFKSLLNKTVESTFELQYESLKQAIRRGNNVYVSVNQCGYSFILLDPSSWHCQINRVIVDYAKHKPVLFKDKSLYGYKDHMGNIVIGPGYKDAHPFLDTGIAAVKGNYGWEYINYFGKSIITPHVENGRPDAFKEGLARYQVQFGNIHSPTTLIGFMNQKGEAVIKAGYKNAYPFSEGLAAVLVESHGGELGERSRWGYIDKKGIMVIKPYFVKVSAFKNGRAVVYTKEGQQAVINRYGEIIE